MRYSSDLVSSRCVGIIQTAACITIYIPLWALWGVARRRRRDGGWAEGGERWGLTRKLSPYTAARCERRATEPPERRGRENNREHTLVAAFFGVRAAGRVQYSVHTSLHSCGVCVVCGWNIRHISQLSIAARRKCSHAFPFAPAYVSGNTARLPPRARTCLEIPWFYVPTAQGHVDNAMTGRQVMAYSTLRAPTRSS